MSAHIRTARGQADAPCLRRLPGWLPHFLALTWHDACPDADEAFFRSVLESGRAVVLLDGLDEAASESDRQTLVELIAAAAFGNGQFVVTSRPAALQGQAVLPTRRP